MRKIFFVFVAFFVFSGTSFNAAAQQLKNSVLLNEGNAYRHGPRFIDGIEINAGKTETAKLVPSASAVSANSVKPVSSGKTLPGIEFATSLHFKYAQLLNRNVEFILNTSLFSFIDEWWATRYRYGGSTKKGIDCSAFTSLLMGTVFAVKLPRTAREQYNECEKLNREELEEGDLVFFNTRGGVSHVGVYLGDNYFVHASTNNGVTINTLDETYYSRRFIGGGRAPGML